jgi:hypothetical protein
MKLMKTVSTTYLSKSFSRLMKTVTILPVLILGVSKRDRNSLPVPPFCRKSLTMSTAPYSLALNASAATMKSFMAIDENLKRVNMIYTIITFSESIKLTLYLQMDLGLTSLP